MTNAGRRPKRAVVSQIHQGHYWFLGNNEVLGNGPHKTHCIRGGLLVALQNGVERKIRTVKGPSVILVLRKNRAIQVDTGEQALSAGVAEELCIQLPIGSSLGIPSNRTRRSRCIAHQS